MSERNPRYLVYCAEHDHAGDPEGMIAADKKTYPGGHMSGFWLWHRAKWLEYMRETGEVPLGRSHDKQFNEWLGIRVEEGEGDAGSRDDGSGQ